MKKLLIATTALVAMATAAQAADLSPRAYHKAPAAVATVHNWTGFYVGAFGGYGFNTSNGANLKGGFGGANLTYLRQVGTFVYGAEVEVAGGDISQTETHFGVTGTAKVDTFGSVAARFGFVIDNALIYGKLGYGWANMKIQGTAGVFTASESKMTGGVAVGAGIEYAFAPHWSVKGEYLWQHMDGKSYFNGAIPLNSTALQTVKLGVSYHFGH